MKLPFIKLLVVLALGLVIASTQAEAISLSGCISSGLLGPDAHTHIATTPIKIYAITVTPTANDGFAMVIQTNSARQDASSATDVVGTGFISGRESYIKADLQGATAKTSLHFEYPDGMNVDEQTFVTSTDAYVELYYKLQ